jgi:hypothetical protein
VSDPNVQSLIDDPAIEAVEIKLTLRDDQDQQTKTRAALDFFTGRAG